MSLRARIALAAASAVAVAVVLAAAATYVLVRSQLRGEVDAALRGRARAAASFGLRFQTGAPFPSIPVEPPTRLGGAGSYIQMVTAGGDVVTPAPGTFQIPISGRTLAVARGTGTAYFRDAVVAKTHVRVLTYPVAAGVALQIVRPLDEVDRTLGRLRLILLAVAAGGIALAAALGVAVTRPTLAPVRRLTGAAEGVTETLDLSHRIDEGGDDELGRLAASFNRMLGALERSVGAQRQLVEDASHELRTPITSIRMNVELLAREGGLGESERRRVLDATIAQLDEMTNLVAEILELARGEVRPASGADVRLDEIVEDAVARASAVSKVEFRTTVEPTVVTGVSGRLARAVGNLLDNAAKWSPPGGTVEVTLSGGELAVRDHGPGLEPEDVPHVFDRFYRSRAARAKPGSGLGLAIVRQVADDHGGAVTVENAAGGGALFRLRLPALPGATQAS